MKLVAQSNTFEIEDYTVVTNSVSITLSAVMPCTNDNIIGLAGLQTETIKITDGDRVIISLSNCGVDPDDVTIIINRGKITAKIMVTNNILERLEALEGKN